MWLQIEIDNDKAMLIEIGRLKDNDDHLDLHLDLHRDLEFDLHRRLHRDPESDSFLHRHHRESQTEVERR